MVEIITTQEERDAISYFDWDDEALGRFTKYVGILLKPEVDTNDKDREGLLRVGVASSLIQLVGQAVLYNAGRLEMSMRGVSRGGEQLGDWEITIQRAGYVIDKTELFVDEHIEGAVVGVPSIKKSDRN